MRSLTKISLALCAITLTAAAWATPALDSAGKCRDNGKFVAQTLCATKPAPAATKCRDKTTKKFAKCDAANTEPVPESKPQTK